MGTAAIGTTGRNPSQRMFSATGIIGFMLATLYRRSTSDEAYVRTGLGGQKVVLDGGSLVLPVFHVTAS